MAPERNIRAKQYYKNFLACGLCYANCFFDDKLQCTVCDKYCYQSCLNISKARFKNLTEYGVDKAICSNKCCAPILPFYTTPDKIFLDTNVGKRKIPCKKCYRECFKVPNCLKCSICAKSYHIECTSPRTRTNSILPDTFFCSKSCELKLLPFHSVESYELIDQIAFDSPSKNVDKSKSTPSLSVSPSQFLTPNNDSNEKKLVMHLMIALTHFPTFTVSMSVKMMYQMLCAPVTQILFLYSMVMLMGYSQS